jgi:hypothetical protein
VVADTLSRVESGTTSPSYDAMAASQETDGELQALLTSHTALQLEKHSIPGTAVSIYWKTSAVRSCSLTPLSISVSPQSVAPRH